MRDHVLHDQPTPDSSVASSIQKASFLSLPFTLRRRIYVYARLQDSSVIHLNYYLPTDTEWEQYKQSGYDLSKLPPAPYISPRSISVSHFLDRRRTRPHPELPFNRRCGGDCANECTEPDEDDRAECEPLPYQLLYASPVLYHEVLSTFFSRNIFNIVQTDPGGLSGLQDLPPVFFASVKSLCIRLNVSDCMTHQGCLHNRLAPALSCHQVVSSKRGHDELLNWQLADHKRAIVEFSELCTRIASHVPPQQLKLCLIFDVADFETAAKVVEALSAIPMLQGLSLRLGLDPKDDRLSDLARKTVLEKTTSSTYQSSPFRYGDLPQEIRLQILALTDLVTPFDVAWTPHRASCGLSIFEFRMFKPWFSNAYTHPQYVENGFSGCCGACSEAKEGCCCWRQRAAYSSSCICWRIPTAMFYVSKQMHEEATSVFFSRNHFVVLPDYGKFPSQCGQLEILRFLKGVPPAALTHIRFLTCIITSISHGFSEQESASHRDRLETIKIMKSTMNIPQLTLAIDFLRARVGFEYHLNRAADALTPHRTTFYNVAHRKSTAVAACAAALILGKSLDSLGPFKNLWIHLSCYWGAYPLAHPYSEDTAEVVDTERRIETQIMGDEYDAVSQGKHARRHWWNGYICAGKCGECPKPAPREAWMNDRYPY